MVPLICDPQEVQRVKDELNKQPRNYGVGVLHEPTGRICLAPFDVVAGGHTELTSQKSLPNSECKGFVIVKQANGTFTAINLSHLNGNQGQPSSLRMPQATFDGILAALRNAGL
jgi:hypothetical protein